MSKTTRIITAVLVALGAIEFALAAVAGGYNPLPGRGAATRSTAAVTADAPPAAAVSRAGDLRAGKAAPVQGAILSTGNSEPTTTPAWPFGLSGAPPAARGLPSWAAGGPGALPGAPSRNGTAPPLPAWARPVLPDWVRASQGSASFPPGAEPRGASAIIGAAPKRADLPPPVRSWAAHMPPNGQLAIAPAVASP